MNNKTVYFLIDCSGSMYGKRGDAVNMAMEKVVKEVVPEIVDQKSADLNIYFKVLGFSGDRTVKQIMPMTPVDQIEDWKPIPADAFDGGTPTGAAIQAVIDDIEGGVRGDTDPDAIPPAIILISDGQPNGTNPSYEEVMECAVKESPKHVYNFRKAIRVALGMDVGEKGRESLKKFGKVSAKMESAGLAAYYDCSEQYTKQFVDILKSATLNASIGSGVNVG